MDQAFFCLSDCLSKTHFPLPSVTRSNNGCFEKNGVEAIGLSGDSEIVDLLEVNPKKSNCFLARIKVCGSTVSNSKVPVRLLQARLFPR